MHALIIGDPGAGKSTLIRHVVEELELPVTGFESKKETALEKDGLIPVYLYEAGKPHRQTEDYLAGYCNGRKTFPDAAAFDRFARRLSAPVPAGTIIVMDEIGIMESRSEAFKREILRLLDGDVPVIAAVKSKRSPFLDSVRNHPKTRCFYLTPDNREELHRQVMAFFREQTV